MTKTTIRFILDAVRGSEFDLWQPVKGGQSKIRPASMTESYWPGHRVDRAKLREFTETLWRELELPNDSCWTEIDLDSPKLPALVARLAELKQADLVKPVRGTVKIKLVDTPEEPCEWFELFPQDKTHHIGNFDAKADCTADKAFPGVHVTAQCVDEKFKALVEENGFTGLEFLWLQDEGKYAAPQWYLVTAQNPIGRGIDHEFFDEAKYIENNYIKPSGPAARIGVAYFDREQLKSPAPFPNPVQNELMALFPTNERSNGLRFNTYRQFLKKFLPDTDFAYSWNGGLFRSICFNRKVRDALVSASLVSSDECEPVKIWQECPPEAQMLDGISPIFPRGRWYFSDEEYIQNKQDAEKAWEFHLANPKPKRSSNMQVALELLKMARNIISPRPSTADVDTAARQLGDRFPQKWQEVLRLTDAFEMDLGDSFYIEPANNLDEYTKTIQESWFADKADSPNKFLHITSGGNGDFHSLDLSTCTPDGDCRVLQFSHETLQPEREWDSIAEFVQEIAETMLAESDED